MFLSEAVLDDELAEFTRLRLFICHWAACRMQSYMKKGGDA
jgi:hypothetical protein